MLAAERLILEKAEKDLDAGLDHVRLRLREEAHGPLAFLARGLEAAVLGGVAALELRPRMREDVTFLMGLAHRVNAGESAEKLAETHVHRVLRIKELGFVVKTKDARFATIVQRCQEAMAKRLPDLGRMVAVADPKDYDDLVLRAFPERAPVDAILADNKALMDWIFAYAEANPDLLRIPKGMIPKLALIGRDVTAWQTAQVQQGLDALYRTPPPS